MFGLNLNKAAGDAALLHALNESLAILEFSPDGLILRANENFCRVMGYGLDEIRGQRHRMFVAPKDAETEAHKEFWRKVSGGESVTGEFRRVGKNDRMICVRATYCSILSKTGDVARVVETISDITEERLRAAEFESKLMAISRMQAVIEFAPDGEILDANQNFLDAIGYNMSEIKGKHHKMFVAPAYAASAEYIEFWRKLNAGEPIVATFRRVGKHGREILLQASYNPIQDLRGRVVKIVKFGTNFTDLAVFGAGMERLASNNLTAPIDMQFQAMFEPLRLSFNSTQDNLRGALTEVSQSVGRVDMAGREIAAASDDLSRRTEQQAAALEQATATLGGVAETVVTSAHRLSEANAAAKGAGVEAAKSNEIVRDTTEAMGRINASSRKIEQIIGVIDEIAFQTNLLALNAGVEAARAGDAGRGFAVVASEVRGLAQRSAEAAKQIKSLISESADQVAEGVKLVSDTGASLTGIVSKIGQINALMSEIASGAQSQAAALKEVSAAVGEMDKATQQNAAMAEETNAAGTSLRSEVERLASLVGDFKLQRDDDRSGLRPSADRASDATPRSHRPARPRAA